MYLNQYPCEKMEGRRIEPFSYTGQTIITEAEWCRKVKYELDRVKKLKGDRRGNKGQWTENRRNGRIFTKDKITVLKGVGPKLGEKFKHYGLELVEDLIKIKDDEEKKR